MRNSDPSPLMDRRTLIAIVVIGVFMMAWQHFMTRKHPPAVPATATPAETQPVRPETEGKVEAPVADRPGEMKAAEPVSIRPEELLSYEDDRIRFTLSNKGMGFKEYVVKNYRNAEGNPVRLGFSPVAGLFEFRLNASDRPLDFDIREEGPGVYRGTAQVGDATLIRTFTYNPEESSLRSRIEIRGWSDELREGLSITIPEVIHSPASSSWLFPSYDHQDFFVEFGGNKNTVNFNHAKESIDREFPTAALVSVGNQYFTLALLDQSSLAPSVRLLTDIPERSALAKVIYKPSRAGEIRFEQVFYAGPKSIDVLKKIDPAMAEVIDFGYLSFIAKPLLYIMKWFHSLVGNWGVAIILLTILVRFVVLPFNLMSARSMRAMQKIQPLMKDLREKHKEDPMTLNKEMMTLMKEHKANPVGGCLPVFLQIPIFFALFRVIGSTVELYQSPFAWWIQDLSSHDAYFVLPVILGFTMFLQQRMTPTTMDPAQAKIMAFLPLVFTVFMLYLPSGLTLYMVVSALFGIIQQWYILRDAPAPVPAVAKR